MFPTMIRQMRTKLTSDAELLLQIERFCDAHGIRPTTFGRQAIGDGNLIPSLREGKRSLTLKTANRVVEFMTGYSS
jgi:hypothetical protein